MGCLEYILLKKMLINKKCVNYPILVFTVVNAGCPKLENIELAGFPNVVPNPIGLFTLDEKND